MTRPVTTRRAYCRCGATVVSTSSDAEHAQGVIDVFWDWHTGDINHGPATAQQAAVARRRREAQAVQP